MRIPGVHRLHRARRARPARPSAPEPAVAPAAAPAAPTATAPTAVATAPAVGPASTDSTGAGATTETAPASRSGSLPGGYVLAASYAWRFVGIVAAIAVIGYVLVQIKLLTISVAIALLVSALLSPIAMRLRTWGAPRALAAAGAFIGGLTAIGLIGWFIVDQIAAGLDDLRTAVTDGINDALNWLETGPFGISASDIEQARESLTTTIQENTNQIATSALTVATVAAEILAGLAIVLFTIFFFLYDGERIWSWIVRLFPRQAEDRVDVAGRLGWRVLVAYARGTIIVAVFDAVAISIGLAILGVPFVVPLGALVFLGAFVPLVGATVAGAVAVLVALAAEGFVTALLALAVVVIVQQIEGDVLQPLVLGKIVRIHPLAILLAVAGGAVVAGVVGALVAVPIVAVVNTITLYLARGENSEQESQPDSGRHGWRRGSTRAGADEV